MAPITDKERTTRINQHLNELNKVPPERHEVVRVPGIGRDPMNCQVISMDADELLLNHRSHRIGAELEDDADWQLEKNDPHGEAAQSIITEYIRRAEHFEALAQSIERDGQQNPGLITHEGVLINGNTRAVAIRELSDPAKKGIRVAVLPQTVKPSDLSLFELRLQMQKELKSDYSLTNELRFVEELSEAPLKLKPLQIAKELRLFPDNPKKAATEVTTRLRMLDFIRRMQQIPKEPLRLTFFDRLKLENMREVLRTHDSRLKEDPAEADRYIKNFLLSALVGVVSVHQIRQIDESFMDEYMLPRLEENESIGMFVGKLVAPEKANAKAPPSGVGKLLKKNKKDDATNGVDVQHLIDVVSQKSKTVGLEAEGKHISLGREDIKDAVKTAVSEGIGQKKLIERAEDKLSAPVDTMKSATNHLAKFPETLAVVIKNPEFDKTRCNQVELAFRRLKKRYREVEATLVKTGIISR